MPKVSTAGRYSKADLAIVSDNPEWTEQDFRKARRLADIFPDLAASIRRGRGPNKKPTKKQVSLRLSPGVIDHFKSTGPGWQTRIDETLQQAMRDSSKNRRKPKG